jgi:5-methylcytosine-specific restriction protein A
MPDTPPRPCSAPGCPTFASHGLCEIHRRERDRDLAAGRGTAAERGYDRTWERLRNMVRAEEPLCAECLAAGMVDRATAVDHIIPIRERPDLRLVRENLQGICRRHHAAKSNAESRKGHLSTFQGARRAQLLAWLSAL